MNQMKEYPTMTDQLIEERLVQGGIKPTAQRIAICRYVLSRPIHPTVEEVKEWIDDNFPRMSLATVYNTLNSMVKGKILKALKFSHTDKVMFDNNTDVHYHFLDENTGEIHDISPDELSIDLKLPKKFEVDEVELLVRGRIKS